eukprot:767001-Hanusia_phi.AAC.2
MSKISRVTGRMLGSALICAIATMAAAACKSDQLWKSPPMRMEVGAQTGTLRSERRVKSWAPVVVTILYLRVRAHQEGARESFSALTLLPEAQGSAQGRSGLWHLGTERKGGYAAGQWSCKGRHHHRSAAEEHARADRWCRMLAQRRDFQPAPQDPGKPWGRGRSKTCAAAGRGATLARTAARRRGTWKEGPWGRGC